MKQVMRNRHKYMGWRVFLLAGCGFAAGVNLPNVFAQKPLAPPEITPPPGNVLFLATHATGTQNYICEPSASGRGAWVFFSPEATLSVPVGDKFRRQVATHFLSPMPDATDSVPAGCTQSPETGEVSCPSWQSSFDSSVVWGSKRGSIQAGLDPSCPNTGSIPCLLLNAVATRSDRRSSELLATTDFIQRLNTTGGSAPAGACTVGDQAQVPYSADYFFYTAEHKDNDKNSGQDGSQHF